MGSPIGEALTLSPGGAGLLIPSLPASQDCCTRKIPVDIVLELQCFSVQDPVAIIGFYKMDGKISHVPLTS